MADKDEAPRAIRLGVIGTGLAVEQLHWPALVRLPDRYRIAAFANHTRPKAEHFAQYTGASMDDYHSDYRDLLARDDVDAVLISLPINLLYAATRDALAAGKDVICEKPCGGNEAEGHAFLTLTTEYPDRTVLIAENYFYRDDLRLAQSLLADGAIGRLHLMAWRLASQNVPVAGKFSGTPWRHHPQYRGGAHLDGGVHQVAQIRMLCGEVARVHGVTQRANATIDAPSDLALNLTFASGAVGDFAACYPDIPIPTEPNDMRLYGTEGVLVLDGEPGKRRVALHRADGTSEEHRFTGIDNGYYGEFHNFSDAVVHGEPLIGTVAQSVANMLVILRGLDAAESGQAVALDDGPGTAGVPIWKPRGAQGLFDGMPGEYTVQRGWGPMADTLAWGILGTGNIARQFARGVQTSHTGTLVAVGSRTREGAERFGTAWSIPHRYDSYEAVLADPDVQAVYIATPHPLHAQWAIAAAEAGKHLLCEKPIGLNHAEAMAIVAAAREHDVFLMEAFMYRCHPQTVRLAQLVREGAIGEVRVIEAAFAYDSAFDAARRQYDPRLGGGGILDVGCYPVSMARLIAGAAAGAPFAEPESLTGAAHLGATGVDEWAAATAKFPGGIVASLLTGVRVQARNAVRVLGSEGFIEVPWPWKPGSDSNVPAIIVRRRGEERQTISATDPRDLYGIEADEVATHVAARQSPAMSWDDTLGNMRALDQWRAAVGLTYPMERPGAGIPTVHRRPLAVRPDAPMTYGTIAGIEKRVSHLVMGVDNQRTLPHAAVMFDDFFARGGTAFDTAWIYANGQCERVLGQWVRDRGIREQAVILDKGAHTPLCTPEWMTTQFMESLERLQMDYVDLYMLHRDNPAVPVGEFIDALNEHHRAGRMRVFGASNWSLARIDEANAYAEAHGLVGFGAVSNNFSLARMVEPVWKGCLSVSDADSRAWLTARQLPLLPWSSQARGFFTDRARPDDTTTDPELARCWYRDDNWHRRARAVEMAKDKHVQPINIALAYVLHQPFPTFPLIGPRTLEETRSSLGALAVTLTEDEVRWLDLE